MEVLELMRNTFRTIFSGNDESLLFRGSVGSGFVNALGLLVVFGLHLLLGRLLGAEEYGKYSLVFAWLGILSVFATMGLETAALRFAAEYRRQGKGELLSGFLRWGRKVVFQTAVVCVLFYGAVVSLLVPGDLRGVFLLGGLTLLFWPTVNFFVAVVRALQRAVEARIFDAVVKPGLVVVVVGLILFPAGWVTAENVVLVYGIVFSGLALLLHRRTASLVHSGHGEPQYDSTTWKMTALPLLAVSAAFLLLSEVDKILLGFFVSSADLGVYSAAVRLSVFVLFGLQAVNAVAAPLIAEVYAHESRERTQEMVSKICLLIAAVSFPILFIVLFFGDFALGLFGADFVRAYDVLCLLCVGQAVNFLLGPCGFLLTMTGHERDSLKILSVTLLVNIFLNIPAIALFGIEGAAAVTACAIAFRNIAAWKLAKHRTGIDSSFFSAISKVNVSTKGVE